MRKGWLLLLPVQVAAGCEAARGGGGGAGWSAVTDMVGDTVVVRTVSGSVWGSPMKLVPEVSIGELESSDDAYLIGQLQSLAVSDDGSIFVYDNHAKALRKYDAEGRAVARFGREGGGPGEYRNPDGGLSVLADGRIVLRDPGNARMTVFTPGGELAGSWPINGGFSMSRQSTVGVDGRLYQPALRNQGAELADWQFGIIVWNPDGTVVDTLAAPTSAFEPPRIEARTENSWSRSSVPFSAQHVWRFSPLGYFIDGIGSRYAINLHRPEGILRIERAFEPVPVLPEERDNAVERATFNMRRMVPDWRWNGPPVPATKPPFRDLFTGRDGRLWVLLSSTGERIPAEEVDEHRDSNRMPPLRWREPVVFDVFEPDGRYLGRVNAPPGFSTYPEPVFAGDYVWAVARGEFDVQQIVRFRLVPVTQES